MGDGVSARNGISVGIFISGSNPSIAHVQVERRPCSHLLPRKRQPGARKNLLYDARLRELETPACAPQRLRPATQWHDK